MGRGKVLDMLECAEGEGENAFFPHQFGEGVYGEWHFVDPITGEFRVRIRTEEDITSVIPWQLEPRDFHRDEDFYCRSRNTLPNSV